MRASKEDGRVGAPTWVGAIGELVGAQDEEEENRGSKCGKETWVGAEGKKRELQNKRLENRGMGDERKRKRGRKRRTPQILGRK